MNEVCWICQGWSHIEFKIPKARVDLFGGANYGNVARATTIVNLHMSFDGFKPHRMTEYHEHHHQRPKKPDISFVLHRMVPPGKLTYYYSIGDLSRGPI